MHEFGYLTLMMALVVSVFSAAASVVGYRRHQQRLEQAGYIAAFAATALVPVPSFAMIYLFPPPDVSVKYVHHYSDWPTRPAAVSTGTSSLLGPLLKARTSSGSVMFTLGTRRRQTPRGENRYDML